MFIIRHALPHDLDDLYALARQTYFINLPPDREIIAHKIEQSLASFRALAQGAGRTKTLAARREKTPSTLSRHAARSGHRDLTGRGDLFLLVLQETSGRDDERGGVVGTSQIVARMGGPGHPRYFMSLATESCHSRSLGIGWTHLVGRMGKDESGPTEIGGLILNHAFRGHPQRLGRLLSFVRFHLIGLYRNHFADSIIAEMLGPITRTGHNPFYEKFTRHFVTRAFADVYRFSQTSREFLETLMPKSEVYLSILDPEVANAAGEVGDDTLPARRMLERLGFRYHNRIDPLDGGPHLEARTGDIHLVRATRRIASVEARAARGARTRGTSGLIVSVLDNEGTFRAAQTSGAISGQRAAVAPDAARALKCRSPVRLGATPLPE